MATQVLIPYQFTKDSFRETCRKIHFFGSQQHDFILSHQVVPESGNNLLISVADLLKKKMENRLGEVIFELQNCHPSERIIVKPLAFENLDIQTIEKHKIDYLVFEMDRLSNANKISAILRKVSCEQLSFQCYFQPDFWQKPTVDLLWVEKEKQGFSKASAKMDFGACFPCVQQEIQNSQKTAFHSLLELQGLKNQYDLIILKG